MSKGVEYLPTGTSGGGSGTVTSVSVTTANGVSGSVADPTTTPAITLALGAIAPTTSTSLLENAPLILDPSLSADGKYCGIVEVGTATATTAFGEVVYLVTATGKWSKAKADVASTSTNQVGLCVVAAASADDPITVLLYGKVRADSLYPTFTVGAPVYISAATAGQLTSTAPTGTTDFVVRVVGYGEDGNTVFFTPSSDYITLA